MTSLAGTRAYRQLAQRQLIDEHGRGLQGHLEEPTGGGRRAVVVVHDFFGLTEHTKLISRRLAEAGYVAFAADLYRGQASTSREGAALLAQGLAWNRVAIELGLAVRALRQRLGGPVALLGFGMGGAAALVGAASIEKLAAAVTFYGIPQDVTVDNAGLKIQGHFATQDHKCTADRIDALDRSLTAHRVSHEFFRYEAVNGFANSTRPEAYSDHHATTAWDRALIFLDAALTGAP